MEIESLFKRLPVNVRRVQVREQNPTSRPSLRAATSVDTKYSKLLGNKGGNRKLAFYQLNYSRSVVRFKYRRIIGFAATENFASLGIQILPLTTGPSVFKGRQRGDLKRRSKTDSKRTFRRVGRRYQTALAAYSGGRGSEVGIATDAFRISKRSTRRRQFLHYVPPEDHFLLLFPAEDTDGCRIPTRRYATDMTAARRSVVSTAK